MHANIKCMQFVNIYACIGQECILKKIKIIIN
jgi:hypothetical protein